MHSSSLTLLGKDKVAVIRYLRYYFSQDSHGKWLGAWNADFKQNQFKLFNVVAEEDISLTIIENFKRSGFDIRITRTKDENSTYSYTVEINNLDAFIQKAKQIAEQKIPLHSAQPSELALLEAKTLKASSHLALISQEIYFLYEVALEDKNNKDAMYQYAIFLLDDTRVYSEIVLKNLRQAAELKHTLAQYKLIKYFATNNKDKKEALKYAEKINISLLPTMEREDCNRIIMKLKLPAYNENFAKKLIEDVKKITAEDKGDRYFSTLKTIQPKPVTQLNDVLDDHFIVSEGHSQTISKEFLIKNMQQLKQAGFTTLFLEHFMYDEQSEMIYYCNTSEPLPPTERMIDVDESFKLENEKYNFTALINAAKTAGIRVVGLDTIYSYQEQYSREHREYHFSDSTDFSKDDYRIKSMNYTAEQIIREEMKNKPNEKWFALTGHMHAQTYHNIPGLCDTTGARCVILDKKDKDKKDIVAFNHTITRNEKMSFYENNTNEIIFHPSVYSRQDNVPIFERPAQLTQLTSQSSLIPAIRHVLLNPPPRKHESTEETKEILKKNIPITGKNELESVEDYELEWLSLLPEKHDAAVDEVIRRVIADQKNMMWLMNKILVKFCDYPSKKKDIQKRFLQAQQHHSDKSDELKKDSKDLIRQPMVLGNNTLSSLTLQPGSSSSSTSSESSKQRLKRKRSMIGKNTLSLLTLQPGSSSSSTSSESSKQRLKRKRSMIGNNPLSLLTLQPGSSPSSTSSESSKQRSKRQKSMN